MHDVEDRPRWLVVRTELANGDRACLTVQDSGVGFDTQGVERLFQPFYTTKSGGMGIGLAVSRTIIMAVSGRNPMRVKGLNSPGMSGPESQRELTRRGYETPVIFITAHSDGIDRSHLLQGSAKDLLSKPFGDIAPLGALDTALKGN
jgi:CheY-like chemotaxis protein